MYHECLVCGVSLPEGWVINRSFSQNMHYEYRVKGISIPLYINYES